MILSFTKYQGAGNDFIMIDARRKNLPFNAVKIRRLCNRQFGIGADGLIMLEKGKDADFSMTYYNADGRESTMCGNGGRCIAAFARDLGIYQGRQTLFTAVDGPHEATLVRELKDGFQIRLKMSDVDGIELGKDYYFLNTGSPHYVKTVQKADEISVYEEGAKIRYNSRFAAEGTNVDFLEYRDEHIYVRTYERGVENETLSCGTGVTASALIAVLYGPRPYPSPLKVKTRGGELKLHYKLQPEGFSEIWLEGPAKRVFSGTIHP